MDNTENTPKITRLPTMPCIGYEGQAVDDTAVYYRDLIKLQGSLPPCGSQTPMNTKR